MIVTMSSASLVPASALSVRPHVAGRETIATRLSPLPVTDPLVGTIPAENDVVSATSIPVGGCVDASRSPLEQPANPNIAMVK